MMFNKDLSIP